MKQTIICSKIDQVLDIDSLASVTTNDEEGLKALLTLKSTGKIPYELKMYEDNVQPTTDVLPHIKKYIRIPRAIVTPLIKDSIPEELFVSCSSNIKLRPEQLRLFHQYHNGLQTISPLGGIIKAPTGFGKTVLALQIIASMGLKTLIVVPTDRIMQQWVEAIPKFLGMKAGIIRQEQLDVQSVTVAMIHTLVNRLKANINFATEHKFRHVLYDEVHVLGARTFSTVASMHSPRIRTGLSATPRRKDGMDEVFLWHIGPILASADIPTSKPKIVVDMYYNDETDHSGCVWSGDLNLGRYLNKLARCKDRTQRIARLVMKAFSKKHSILVLTDRLSMVDNIRKELVRLGVQREFLGICTGGMKDLSKPIIVGTYGSAGMGLDIPNLSCLFLATPRTDIEQAVGRVLRLHEGKQFPVVVDIVDASSIIMQKWFRKRRKFYNKYCEEVKFISNNGGKDAKTK